MERGRYRKREHKNFRQAVVIILILIIAIVVLNRVALRRKSALSSNAGVEEVSTSNVQENKDNTSDDEGSGTSEDGNTASDDGNTSSGGEGSEEDTNFAKPLSYKAKYYIRVNIQENVVNIYEKDENGEYTKPYKAMLCSTGTATPKSGVYATTQKYRWLPLFGDVFGQYSTRIVDHILFHSVPYTKKSEDSLEYWEYDKLGTSASAGCIRLTVEDALWIYENCESGTNVEFYSSSNPGPLGKPTAKKISDEDDKLKNWDPTDPSEKNPWKK